MTLFTLFLLGCPGDDTGTEKDDTSGGGATDATVEISIASPGKGESFDFGSEITFTVETTSDGKAIDPDKVTWSSGRWSDTGASVTTSDLPSGEITVDVEVKVDGDIYSDSVTFTIKDPPPLDYRGTADISLFIRTEDYGDFDVACPGNLNFVMTGSNFNGTGSCTDDLLGETYQFSIGGTSSGGNIEGEIALNIDGTDYPTPFTGTGEYGQALSASYDETYQINSDGVISVRVSGSWSANPVGR